MLTRRESLLAMLLAPFVRVPKSDVKWFWNDESGKRLGGVKMPFGRMFDANGEELPRGVTWCNVTTGEYEMFQVDSQGKKVFNATRDDAVRVIRKAVTPLRFVPRKDA